jgi:hypothetical protein
MIQTPVILDSHRSLKDGSIKLIFETQDITLNQDTITQILGSLGKYGYLAFQPGENPVSDAVFRAVEAPQREKTPEKVLGHQKPSKRLRSAIYVLWEKKGKTVSFDDYYAEVLEFFRKKILSEIERLEDET